MAKRDGAAGDVIDQLNHDLGLSSDELASALGISPHAIERWRTGAVLPAEDARIRLTSLLALRRHLHETFVAEDVPGWLRSKNLYLGGSTPVEAIVIGRFDQVEGALAVIDHGIFL